ncbi:MAG: hypothetical protein WAZ21_00095 [Candidatus Saccharimonadales bacterium]
MDIQPQNQQPISDDQELAKVLAGVTQQADENVSGLQFEETQTTPIATPTVEEPVAPVVDAPVIAPIATPVTNDLEEIKKDALSELRPLIDKLDVSPEEKFDTLLLIIRSTDDQSLLAATHEAAKAIPDDSRRAQALLDIIKEIDFFSNKA